MDRILLAIFVLNFVLGHSLALKKDDCQVCFAVVEKFTATLTSQDRKDFRVITDKFREFCKGTKGKENRFCYYIGGLEESSTGILNEISKPLSWSMPVDKVCEKLNKKDIQICEMKLEKKFDLNSVDLRKLKVRDLKNILADFDAECNHCIEKRDFIERIKKLKASHGKS